MSEHIKLASAQKQHQHDSVQCVKHSLDWYYEGYTRQSVQKLSGIVQDHIVCYTRFPLVNNVIGTDHICPSVEDYNL